LRGKHFASDNDVIGAVDEFLGEQEESFFRDGLKKLEHQWNNCIVVRGDYVEK